MSTNPSYEALSRSKQRVAEHGEVFTPRQTVNAMLDLVEAESERIDSRLLEPACGSGNFLIAVLERKLATVQLRYGKSDYERKNYALLALSCIYGIELLADNVAECRQNLVKVLSEYLQANTDSAWSKAAQQIVRVNIIHGDALSMTTAEGEPMVFAEWAYLGRGKFQRRDFLYDALARRSSYQGTLWDHLEEHEIFSPIREYKSMTIEEILS